MLVCTSAWPDAVNRCAEFKARRLRDAFRVARMLLG